MDSNVEAGPLNGFRSLVGILTTAKRGKYGAGFDDFDYAEAASIDSREDERKQEARAEMRALLAEGCQNDGNQQRLALVATMPDEMLDYAERLALAVHIGADRRGLVAFDASVLPAETMQRVTAALEPRMASALAAGRRHLGGREGIILVPFFGASFGVGLHVVRAFVFPLFWLFGKVRLNLAIVWIPIWIVAALFDLFVFNLPWVVFAAVARLLRGQKSDDRVYDRAVGCWCFGSSIAARLDLAKLRRFKKHRALVDENVLSSPALVAAVQWAAVAEDMQRVPASVPPSPRSLSREQYFRWWAPRVATALYCVAAGVWIAPTNPTTSTGATADSTSAAPVMRGSMEGVAEAPQPLSGEAEASGTRGAAQRSLAGNIPVQVAAAQPVTRKAALTLNTREVPPSGEARRTTGTTRDDEVDAPSTAKAGLRAGRADAPSGMVFVAAGAFTMGSDDGKSSEKPSRSVTISRGFFIDKTEVTAGAYQQCVDSSRCVATSLHGPAASPKAIETQSAMCTGGDPARSNYPINCIDRTQAEVYCQYLGKRLPTEAEWEYAARGTDGRVFPWGAESPVGCDVAVTAGCIAHLGEVGVHPRGASPFGALDMAGNVWEWVADGWSDEPAGVGATDPLVPPSRYLGLLRGGSWDFSAPFSRASSRLKFSAASGHVSTGVRCAKDG